MKSKEVAPIQTTVLDTEMGIARDVIEIYHGDNEIPIYEVANFSLEDNDQLRVQFGEEESSVCIFIPLDRLCKLIGVPNE
jgi:hypothetical protein